MHLLHFIAIPRTSRILQPLHRRMQLCLLFLLLTSQSNTHLHTLQRVLQLQLLRQQTVLLIALAQRLARLVVQVRRLLPVQTLDLCRVRRPLQVRAPLTSQLLQRRRDVFDSTSTHAHTLTQQLVYLVHLALLLLHRLLRLHLLHLVQTRSTRLLHQTKNLHWLHV